METAVVIENMTEIVSNYSQSLSDAQLVSQPNDQSRPSAIGSDRQITTGQESESDNESSPKIPRLEETEKSEISEQQNSTSTETVSKYKVGAYSQWLFCPNSAWRHYKLERVYPMTVVSILPHAEFRCNDHRE